MDEVDFAIVAGGGIVLPLLEGSGHGIKLGRGILKPPEASCHDVEQLRWLFSLPSESIGKHTGQVFDKESFLGRSVGNG